MNQYDSNRNRITTTISSPEGWPKRRCAGIVETLAHEHSFAYTIGVMPITVAALMTPRWLLRHLDVPPEATHVIVPGYCDAGSG